MDAVNLETGEVMVIDGKGGKTARTFVPASGLPILNAWIRLRGDAPGPFLKRIDRSDEIGSGGVGKQSIYKRCRFRADRIGRAKLRPHDLRRTFCTRLLQEGGNLMLASKLMRHEKIDTTQRYDYRGVEETQGTADLFPVPSWRE